MAVFEELSRSAKREIWQAVRPYRYLDRGKTEAMKDRYDVLGILEVQELNMIDENDLKDYNRNNQFYEG